MTRNEYNKYFNEASNAADKAIGMTLGQIKQEVETREERNTLRKAWNNSFDQYWSDNLPTIPEDWNYDTAEEQ